MEIVMIRHGKTGTNAQGLFAGRGDHPLTGEFIEEMTDMVAKHPYPPVDRVYTSPAVRCRETLAIAYPQHEGVVVEDLWEFDFGEADGMPVQEAYKLIDLDRYDAREPDFCFPGGETFGAFDARVVRAIDAVVQDAAKNGYGRIAVVTHVIVMDRILTQLAKPPIPDEERLCANGMGIGLVADETTWAGDKTLRFTGVLPEGAPRESFLNSPYYRKPEETNTQK